MKSTKTTTGVLFVLLAIASQAKAANLLVNPGFEDGGANWSFANSSGVHVNDGLDPAHSGNFEAYTNRFSPGFGSLTQSVPTIIGHDYLVDFWIAGNGSYGDVTVSFGGAQIYFEHFVTLGETYLFRSAVGTASATSSDLTVYASGMTGTLFYDDFSVTDTAQATPEPGTLGLTFGALFAAAQLRRRKK